MESATSYLIYWSSREDLSAQDNDGFFESDTTRFIHTQLSASQKYYYVIVAQNDDAQSEESDYISATPYWEIQLYGTDDNHRAMDIIIDESNGLSIGGRIRNLEPPINDKTFISILSDINSNVMQSKQFDNDYQNFIVSMAYDSDYNTCITGYFDNTDNIFITKYNTEIVELWTVSIDTEQTLSSKDIAVDSLNNVYITGSTINNLSTYLEESAKGARDIFIAKYDSQGITQWIHQLGTNCDDYGTAIVIDSDDDIYVTGTTACELVPDENKDGDDYFMIKYDSAGNQQWLRQYGAAGDDNSYDIEIDSDGYIYVTGQAVGSESYDAFINKIDPDDGSEVWTQPKFFGAESFADCSYGIAIDSKNNIYITGYTLGDVKNADAQSLGYTDVFVARLNSDGIFTSKQIGTTEYDYAMGIAINSSDTPFVTGYTSGDLGGKKVFSGEDAFIWKVPDF